MPPLVPAINHPSKYFNGRALAAIYTTPHNEEIPVTLIQTTVINVSLSLCCNLFTFCNWIRERIGYNSEKSFNNKLGNLISDKKEVDERK
jgi:hypothetical protein